MNRSIIRSIAAAAVMALITAACGSEAIAKPATPTLLVLVDGRGPGLYHPFDLLQPHVPRLALYSDGRLVMVDETDEVHASYTIARVREGALADVLTAATAAGLSGPDRDLGFAGVAGATTAVVTVYYPAGPHTTTADGYWDGLDDGSLSEADRDARAALGDFLDRLIRPGDWWLEGEQAEPYVPGDWAAVWSEVDEVDELPFEPTVRPWILEAALGGWGQPVSEARPARCAVLDDVTAARILAQLRPETVWESEGETYYVYLRPLLPHELTDCATASR